MSSKIFITPQNMLPPYSNVVPAPEFHRGVVLLLSSQSRIPFSGGYELVKLHSLTSQSPHPKNKKAPQDTNHTGRIPPV